jgi:hypothetical protein
MSEILLLNHLTLSQNNWAILSLKISFGRFNFFPLYLGLELVTAGLKTFVAKMSVYKLITMVPGILEQTQDHH